MQHGVLNVSVNFLALEPGIEKGKNQKPRERETERERKRERERENNKKQMSTPPHNLFIR
jgi:hypothetical protein